MFKLIFIASVICAANAGIYGSDYGVHDLDGHGGYSFGDYSAISAPVVKSVVAAPIAVHAPVVKSIVAAPVAVKSGATSYQNSNLWSVNPVQVSVPVVKSVVAAPVYKSVVAAPVYKSVVAAPVYKSVVAAPVYKSVVAAPVYKSVVAAPIAYKAAVPVSYGGIELGHGLGGYGGYGGYGVH